MDGADLDPYLVVVTPRGDGHGQQPADDRDAIEGDRDAEIAPIARRTPTGVERR